TVVRGIGKRDPRNRRVRGDGRVQVDRERAGGGHYCPHPAAAPARGQESEDDRTRGAARERDALRRLAGRNRRLAAPGELGATDDSEGERTRNVTDGSDADAAADVGLTDGAHGADAEDTDVARAVDAEVRRVTP